MTAPLGPLIICMFPSRSLIAVVEEKSDEHVRRQKAENAYAAALEMAAECTI